MSEAGDAPPQGSLLDVPDSLDKLRKAVAACPTDQRARLRLSQALLRNGETEAARAALLPLSQSDDDAIWLESVASLAQIQEQLGRTEEAAVLWERLLAVDVDHPAARAHLHRLRRARVPSTPGSPALPRADATLLSPEGVVASRYEILSELGRGGTSTVFLARDSELDVFIALKVLHPFLGAATRSDVRQRFFREARLAAALRHPGVVAIYDLDEATRSLAMEYLPLGTLRHRLTQLAADGGEPRLPPTEIERLVRGLLETLVHVHDAGLVHGDLKPRNILLRSTGVPVLGDFGVARLLSLDVAAGPAGTPLYFAPEQLLGAASNVSTDLFAVGAMIWEMAAGRPMRTRADLTSGRFAAPALPEDARAHLEAASPTLITVVAATTATEAQARPQSARQVLDLLG